MAEEGPVTGLGWLVSPLPIAGLLVMALNDHWLRPRWGNAWTFKLSDFAVLCYFPALLCALASLAPRPWQPRALSRPAVILACSASGLALAGLNLSPSLAEAYSRALEALAPGSYLYTPDPSDCLALIVLPAVAADGLRRLKGSASEVQPSSEAQA